MAGVCVSEGVRGGVGGRHTGEHTLQTPYTWDRCPVSISGGLAHLLINPALLGNSGLYLVKASCPSHLLWWCLQLSGRVEIH